MSNNSPLAVISSQEKSFTKLIEEKGYPVLWKQECIFARQQITKSDFSFKVASNNPNSLQTAILNVAAIGISLNPALAHAYLVPRDGAIYLDISYKGLVKIATDSGAIQWAKSELVYKNDRFVYKGPALAPEHEADVFGDRGEIIGGYCIAKLPTGEHLIEVMKREEIDKVRDVSKAYQKGKGPWVDWYEEMAKKTITKRASKSWPQTENRERLDNAIQALHESEGTVYTLEQQAEFLSLIRDKDALGLLQFMRSTPENVVNGLFNSFEKGTKTEQKQVVRELEQKAYDDLQTYAVEIIAALENDDQAGAMEIYNDLPADLIKPFLGDHINQIEQITTEQAA